MEEFQMATKMVFTMFDDPGRGGVVSLVEPFSFIGADGSLYTIPAGFESDGASVPRFFWRFMSPKFDSLTLEASVMHDFGYERHIGTRAQVDAKYYSDLVAYGYPRWKAKVTYYAVRIFGGPHWKRC